MLDLDLACFESSVDPEKPADLDPHCFHLCLSIDANNWNLLNQIG